ncbi:hypothetical protein GCM10027514_38350 [Azotobacter armeniacus]
MDSGIEGGLQHGLALLAGGRREAIADGHAAQTDAGERAELAAGDRRVGRYRPTARLAFGRHQRATSLRLREQG